MTKNPDENIIAQGALASYVSKLHKQYEVWYAKSVRRVGRWWYVLQTLSVTSGFATAVIAALSLKYSNFYSQILLIILPFLSGLASAILQQFRVYDLWQIREDGRTAFQRLAEEGDGLLASVQSHDDYVKARAYLQEKAAEIESDQRNRFFALSTSNFVSKYIHPNVIPEKQQN